jgi:hypothetical protein
VFKVTESLNREDWERIVFALSHFLHNTKFRETHEKVSNILTLPGKT